MKSAFEPLPQMFRPCQHVAGVDEVGRGPLAGPVVAAAVILPEGFDCAGLGDSKTISAARREELAERVMASAQIGIAYIPAPMIDAFNIRQASLLAMRNAISALPVEPDGVMVDGRDVPPNLHILAQAFIKGDSRFAQIAAASIVAKVARDRMMKRADAFFSGYDFSKNMGYPTKAHQQALVNIGLSPLHRKSFAPCRLQAS